MTGDVDCSGAVDPVDALTLLRFAAGLPVSQAKGCAEIGSQAGLVVFGDIDCDSDVDTVDGLVLLRFAAGLGELEECVLQGLLPTKIAGVTMRLYGADGDSLLASDAAWMGAFKTLGIEASAVDMAIAAPPPGSPLVFQMAVVQTAGAPWNPRLGGYITRVTQASGGSIDAVNITIDGRLVRRLTDTTDPAAPVYYHADGDLLYVIHSNDRDIVDGIIEGLPDGKETASTISPQGAKSGGLALHFAAKPFPAPCVASPEPDGHLLVMAFDTTTAVPAIGVGLNATAGGLGEATPALDHSFAPAQDVLYQATRFDVAGESLSLTASTPWGDAGSAGTSFAVRHCLSGTWRDGPRVLGMNQGLGGGVMAQMIEGALECGATGQAFSGQLDGDVLSGDDLLVCAPDLCYDNGLMERTALDAYDAIVSNDGYTIDVDWHRRYYLPVANDDGDYVECVPAQTIKEHFQVRRLTFGP